MYGNRGGVTAREMQGPTRLRPPVLVFLRKERAYEIPKRDWSSDVCSSDLHVVRRYVLGDAHDGADACVDGLVDRVRSEEHTSELQSRFGISYAVFCLKK